LTSLSASRVVRAQQILLQVVCQLGCLLALRTDKTVLGSRPSNLSKGVNMRMIIGVLGATTLAAAAIAGAGASSTQGSNEALITNERELYAAVAKGDTERFRALTLPEGIWTTPSSFVPMGPIAEGLRAFELPKWSIENPHVVWTDGNSALLLYVRTGGGSYDHRPFAPMMLASTLWTKRGGKWVAVHHQESENVP
jgi:hypothetical protein